MTLLQVTNYPTKAGSTYEVHGLEVTRSVNYESKDIIRFRCTSSKGSGLWKRIREYETSLQRDGAKYPVICYSFAYIQDEAKKYTLLDPILYESVEDGTDTYYVIFECYSEQVKEKNIYDATLQESKSTGPRSGKARTGKRGV